MYKGSGLMGVGAVDQDSACRESPHGHRRAWPVQGLCEDSDLNICCIIHLGNEKTHFPTLR